MILSWQFALRFLFRLKRAQSLKKFTLVSILSITFSVMLFLLIDTVINGLMHNLQNTFIGFEAPLFIEHKAVVKPEVDDAVKQFIKKNPQFGLNEIQVKEFDGLIEVPDQSPRGVKVRSVSLKFFELKKDSLEIYWFDGFDAKSLNQNSDQVVVGESLYETMHFLPGDEEKVLLTHPYADLGPGGEIEPQQRTVKVAGIFTTGRMDFDDVFVLTSEQTINAMANDSFVSHQIFLYPKDASLALAVQKKWTQFTQKKNFKLKTWLDKNKNLFKAIKLEKLMYLTIFIFIVMISGFNMAGVVSIFGIRKSKDAAIFKTLGLSKKSTRDIFINIGLLLGGIGAVLGIGLGLITILIAKYSGFSLPESYGFTQLPLTVNLKTIFLLIILTPIFSALIAYYPAFKVSSKNITDVLRWS